MRLNIVLMQLITALMLGGNLDTLAETSRYVSVCGKDKTMIKWTQENKDGKIYLTTIQGDERHEYIIGKGYKTESWKIFNPITNTYLTISLDNGTYSINGKLNGKHISKSVKSKGKSWYQNIAYSASHILGKTTSIDYECFRPDNIKLYTMSATKKNIEDFDGMKAIRIEVCLTGFMSVFWKCNYYFDAQTKYFVGYRGVNGGPGTPETKITVLR